MKYQLIRTTPLALKTYTALFQQCFPNNHLLNFNYLEWLYLNNPEGKVVGFDAFYNGELAAHYACIPITLNLEGTKQKALLSLNTATLPKYQGKGLFTRLASITYEYAKENGYVAVIGVANQNSTHGFIKNLGFTLITPLEAKIGCGPLNINFENVDKMVQLERYWSELSLKWRSENPNNQIYVHNNKNRTLLFSNTKFKLPVFSETNKKVANKLISKKYYSPVGLFLGLIPKEMSGFNYYYPIPNRLKPSPLNFIFKALNKELPPIKKDSVFFSFLDFDAY